MCFEGGVCVYLVGADWQVRLPLLPLLLLMLCRCHLDTRGAYLLLLLLLPWSVAPAVASLLVIPVAGLCCVSLAVALLAPVLPTPPLYSPARRARLCVAGCREEEL